MDEALQDAAEAMIARHLRLSVPNSLVRDRLAEQSTWDGYPADKIERRLRCVAVVGAGASFPLVRRADALADKLEADFGRDEAVLDRLERVYHQDRTKFETRLVALGRTPELEDGIREAISSSYSARFPTLLVYELLAHLLKHRYLDAIISFNFDEFLDQSLDDELDSREYRKVVSERDCVGIEEDPDADRYLPLYLKLHGTASEPRSLRFTPESYYSIPRRLTQAAERVLLCDHCVVLNVGFGLESFDFQRLLGLPRELDLINMSYEPVLADAVREIDSHRNQVPTGPEDAGKTWLHELAESEQSSGYHVDALARRITDTVVSQHAQVEAGDGPRKGSTYPVEFRSVRRHRVSSELLGPDSLHSPQTLSENAAGEEAEYLRRRTILELAFAGAKARGLLSLVPLAIDRPSRYFERYKAMVSGKPDAWREVCSAAGLKESVTSPDVLVSKPDLRPDAAHSSDPTNETRELHEFDTTKLAKHLLNRIKNLHGRDDCELLKGALDELQGNSDVEIHTTDDRVCSKAFRRPVILRTATSMRAYTQLMLGDIDGAHKRKGALYISSETGGWLLHDKTVQELIDDVPEIFLLTAFDTDRGDLKDHYGSRLEMRTVDPWRHNRHMTIVWGRGPERAVYFARRLRSPVITPVYLDGPRDVQRLKTLYDARWDEAAPRDGRSGQIRRSGTDRREHNEPVWHDRRRISERRKLPERRSGDERRDHARPEQERLGAA